MREGVKTRFVRDAMASGRGGYCQLGIRRDEEENGDEVDEEMKS